VVGLLAGVETSAQDPGVAPAARTPSDAAVDAATVTVRVVDAMKEQDSQRVWDDGGYRLRMQEISSKDRSKICFVVALALSLMTCTFSW